MNAVSEKEIGVAQQGKDTSASENADPCLGSSFPNKATKLLHTQTFPRHSQLLLEH